MLEDAKTPTKTPKYAVMGIIQQYRERKFTTNHVRQLNNIVICLMILVAINSIVWTVAMHILSGDFYNGIIGVKLAFRKRDFTQMDNTAKDIFYHDLGRIINETYTEVALDDDDIRAEALVLPKVTNDEKIIVTKPKVRKIAHVFQISNSKEPDTPQITTNNNNDDNDNENTKNSLPKVPKVVFNIEKDRKYLAHMSIDIVQTRWLDNFAVNFIYGFSFLSEIVAVVWTAMCFIFQSGVKKQWGLPKPWRIVVPSIIMFTIMSVANLSYLILANGFLKKFCNDLRENLTKPDAISCGDAMSVLRPIIKLHDFSHDHYLLLFKSSYIIGMIIWTLALLLMVLRFLLAIDFQTVDIETSFDRDLREGKIKENEFVEVLLSSPQYIKKPKENSRNERPHSEDDFQSAKSHVSEVATPLLVDNVTIPSSATMNSNAIRS